MRRLSAVPLAAALGVAALLALTGAGSPPPPSDSARDAAAPGAVQGAPPGAVQGAAPGAVHARSPVIYPREEIALVFDHGRHLREPGVSCATCHSGATTSRRVSDRLRPTGVTCDRCHGTDHASAGLVTFTARRSGETCATCHVGWTAADGGVVAPSRFPTAHLRDSAHATHAARNIGCATCHGDLRQRALATRDDLPTMETCLHCHDNPTERAADLRGPACTLCHEPRDDRSGAVGLSGARLGGTIRVQFPEGTLIPKGRATGAAHDANFLDRHRFAAGEDSSTCGACHNDAFCVDCHDGRVRPRNVHPGDYLSMHAAESRLRASTCTSCHQETSFCLPCHQRAGVAVSSPLGRKDAGRFHPPKEIFTELPRRPGHHATEAMRNLDACVSCHTERDCVACHGAGSRGGGFTPHGSGFVGRCGTLFARNPRPCLVCHDPTSAVLELCR